jgi:heme A synthase
MATSKLASVALTILAFLTGMVGLVIPWVCYYVYQDNRRAGDLGMANVMLFLVVTPIVALLGGILGVKFKQTKSIATLKFSGAVIWLSFVMCIALRGTIYTALASLGRASQHSGPNIDVTTNAVPPK